MAFPYLKCVFFVALFQFGFELVVVHVESVGEASVFLDLPLGLLQLSLQLGFKLSGTLLKETQNIYAFLYVLS